MVGSEKGFDHDLILTVGGVALTFIVDSGSDVNIINENSWDSARKRGVAIVNMKKGSNMTLMGYGSNVLTVMGEFTADIQMVNANIPAQFIVVKGKGQALLGRRTATELGILQIEIPVTNKRGSVYRIQP